MSDDYSSMKSALNALKNNAFNIQSLLNMAQEGKKSVEILEHIAQAVKIHFERVEALDIDIPEENKKDHKEILSYLESLHDEWCNGMISDEDYAEILNLRLFNHFSLYFQPLLDTRFEEASSLRFRL